MKIAIVCHPTYGGSGVVASELGMHMATRGHEVHFVSYQLPFRVDRARPNVHFHEVEVTSYPLFRYPPYALALATKLVSVVRTHGVRVIHAHYAIPHAISAILTKQMCCDCGVRILTTLHGTDITIVGSDHSFAEVTRFGIDGSDAVTAVSQNLADDTHRLFGTEKPIEVIPNFVDTELYSPARRSSEIRRRFAADDEKLIVHISNFRRVKRVEDAVRVFARTRKSVAARMLFIGNGPERGAAEDVARQLGVLDDVHFEGTISSAHELLAGCDLLLLPSENESFGLVALEAMASGVPVIATAAGGVPEVVTDGECGRLHPVGDVDGMARSAVELLTDDALHARYARNGRERAAEHFSVDRIVDRYEQLYSRLT